MDIYNFPDFDHHEQVSFFDDEATGLRATIVIHSTAVGATTCGGVRMYPYATVDAAITDALRLSRGMSYKSAIAGLPLGGAKAVMIGDPITDKTRSRLVAFADMVNALGGRYYTAMDYGMAPEDMPIIASRTRYVTAFDQAGKKRGDSGPLTALGVYVGVKAAVKHRFGVDDAKGMTVAVQGLGKVGMLLASYLHREGAKLIVADPREEQVRVAVHKFGAHVAAADDIITAECDVFSPNAIGAIFNDKTVDLLRAKIVAGAANNQLARDDHGKMLAERGVLYAPDYVINGGGIICAAGQIFDWDNETTERHVLAIGNTLSAIFKQADNDHTPTNIIADRMAEERMARGRANPSETRIALAKEWT